MSTLSIFIASAGFFLVYLGFAWCVAQALQANRRKYSPYRSRGRSSSQRL